MDFIFAGKKIAVSIVDCPDLTLEAVTLWDGITEVLEKLDKEGVEPKFAKVDELTSGQVVALHLVALLKIGFEKFDDYEQVIKHTIDSIEGKSDNQRP